MNGRSHNRSSNYAGIEDRGAVRCHRHRRIGHQCVVYDTHPETVQALAKVGEVGGGRGNVTREFVHKLSKPRALWMMVPTAAVDPTLKAPGPLLEHDDVVIDGGNSYYHDDIRRAAELRADGIHYVDVETSGGVWGWTVDTA